MKAVVRGTSKLTDADRHAMAVYIKRLRLTRMLILIVQTFR